MLSDIETKTKKRAGQRFRAHLGFLTLSLFPLYWIAEKFMASNKRGDFWRRGGRYICHSVYNRAGVKFHLHHQERIPAHQPVIYAANHPTDFDGFALLAILGSGVVHIIAPLGQFPFIVAAWLRKMEAIDVRRDSVDDVRYPHSHSKAQSLKKALAVLKSGRSLVIFPEGHVDILHTLHYFHTGAARIALHSGCNIVPVGIVNAEQVFPDEKVMTPGTITFNFGEQLQISRLSFNKKHLESDKVLALRDRIFQAITDLLPLRYLPNYCFVRNKKIGVFVDIDRTIYHGFSQKDLIAYLVKMHKIDYRAAMKIFYWLYLEKKHEIDHAQMMERALLVLRGWDVSDLQSVVHHTFYDHLVKNIEYGLFPILKDHAEQGHSIVFVSEVIHPLAVEFKKFFAASATLDTRMQIAKHHYTGQVTDLCYKDEKARLLQQFSDRAHIDLDASYAYADSASDLPFLELVKYPYAVNPDQELEAFAEKNHFVILPDAS
jgi:HAD superfamily hydrolase (TIGR01490 family)